MTIVELKVTDVPVQITLPGLAEMLITGVTDVFTVIVMPGLTTGVVLAHMALLVMVTVITSPVTRALSVYAGLLVPTVMVPFFH